MNTKAQQPQELDVLYEGKQTKVYLPSGNTLDIRELNGEDEEVISSEALSENGDNIYQFLVGIILKDYSLKRKPTVEDLKRYPINDKYYLLYKQRLINHGVDLEFSSICSTPSCNELKTDFHEDISKFDGDLSDAEYSPGNYNQIKKYPFGQSTEIEFTLSSGKKMKYEILNGILELEALELADQTKNAPLKIRKLMLKNGDSWLKVLNFRAYSVKEMAEIRANITKADSQFDPIVNYQCPKCKRNYFKSLFAIPTFFYPEVSM